MLEAVGKVFPKAKYQRCTIHFYRNVFSVTPRSKVKLTGGHVVQGNPLPGKQESYTGKSQNLDGATAFYEAEKCYQKGGG